MKSTTLSLVALLAVGGCDPQPSGNPNQADSPTAAVDTDSLTSMTHLLRRFQAQVAPPPGELQGGTRDRDALGRQFVAALERGDTLALERLIVTPSEFGHLYFPESVFMRPPYDLDPAVVWMQLDAATTTGMRRGLQQHAGTRLGYLGLTCSPPHSQGSVRIHGCDVRRLDSRGDTLTERMFGPILERGGRFKFLSLQNRL